MNKYSIAAKHVSFTHGLQQMGALDTICAIYYAGVMKISLEINLQGFHSIKIHKNIHKKTSNLLATRK